MTDSMTTHDEKQLSEELANAERKRIIAARNAVRANRIAELTRAEGNARRERQLLQLQGHGIGGKNNG